ncbi:MAG: hypothetical protein WBC92_16890 [Terracidiphilus sp.]
MLVRVRYGSILILLVASFVLAASANSLRAQQPGIGGSTSAAAGESPAAIPDAPAPQIELAASADPQSGQSERAGQPAAPSSPAPPSAAGAPQNNASPSNSGSQQSNSGSQAAGQQPSQQESQHQKAAEQIKEQEKQRIAGILPSFNVTYRSDAASMTARQKIGLAFRSAVDPYQFGIAFVVAGFSEAQDQGTGFGWGPEGYFKRSGAAYLDAFDGAMIGNGFLPALLHQDPRYFRLGHGSFHHRLFYAIATSYICKHDNTGKWEPNYSNVGGNIIAGAISNLYYPSQTAGLGQTIDNGLIVTTEGTFGGVLQEFWPDISRKLFHKDPTNGLDAQAAAADKARKKGPSGAGATNNNDTANPK